MVSRKDERKGDSMKLLFLTVAVVFKAMSQGLDIGDVAMEAGRQYSLVELKMDRPSLLPCGRYFREFRGIDSLYIYFQPDLGKRPSYHEERDRWQLITRLDDSKKTPTVELSFNEAKKVRFIIRLSGAEYQKARACIPPPVNTK